MSTTARELAVAVAFSDAAVRLANALNGGIYLLARRGGPAVQ